MPTPLEEALAAGGEVIEEEKTPLQEALAAGGQIIEEEPQGTFEQLQVYGRAVAEQSTPGLDYGGERAGERAEALVRGAETGLLLGWNDEARAALRSMTEEGSPERERIFREIQRLRQAPRTADNIKTMNDYLRALKLTEDARFEGFRKEEIDQLNELREKHPWLFGGGEIGGAVATSVLPVSGAVKAARAAGAGGRGIIAALGAEGAAEGALRGAGVSEPGERGSGAAVGALVEGALGAGIPVLGRLVRSAADRAALRALFKRYGVGKNNPEVMKLLSDNLDPTTRLAQAKQDLGTPLGSISGRLAVEANAAGPELARSLASRLHATLGDKIVGRQELRKMISKTGFGSINPEYFTRLWRGFRELPLAEKVGLVTGALAGGKGGVAAGGLIPVPGVGSAAGGAIGASLGAVKGQQIGQSVGRYTNPIIQSFFDYVSLKSPEVGKLLLGAQRSNISPEVVIYSLAKSNPQLRNLLDSFVESQLAPLVGEESRED